MFPLGHDRLLIIIGRLLNGTVGVDTDAFHRPPTVDDTFAMCHIIVVQQPTLSHPEQCSV